MRERTRRFWLTSVLATTVLAGVTGAGAQITPPRMVRSPDIHGDRIVFSAEGDLWLGSIAGGTASRITTHEANEDHPRFSPDGKQIAFTGGYDGGSDVYVMPAEGGAPRRLTFDPFGAQLVGWTPDGSKILFRSARAVPETGPRLYLVPFTGGLPQPLPMERAAQGSFSPDGSQLAYCRLPMENHHWKRYRGGEANRVWIADLKRKSFVKINDDTINEQYPVWVGDSIYYVSERDGTANLWRYDTKTKHTARLTAHDTYDVIAPASDGQKIIYQWGNSLWTYDVKSGKESQIKLTLASDSLHARPHYVPGTMQEFDLGPTGKRVVIQGRGQMATLPAEKGEPHPIALQMGTRAKNPQWSPDGKWIAFVSDRSGEENLWIAPSSGQGEPKRLTNESKLHLDGPRWSPDSKRIAFRDNALGLYLLDLESRTKTEVARGDYGGIGDYAFAPDGKWLAYARPENFFVSSLYLYNIAQKQATRLTSPPTQDSAPTFDPTGKYLYFLSQRSVKPKADPFDFQNDFDKTTKIYLLTLAKETASPMPDDSDEEPGSLADAKPESKPSTPPPGIKPGEVGKPPLTTPPAAPVLPDVKVDLEGIADRILELPIVPGDYRSLGALPGKILYLAPGGEGPPTLKMYDFGAKKESVLAPNVSAYTLSADSKKIAINGPGRLQIADAGAPLSPEAKRVDVAQWQIPVDPEKEWHQIFEEAWRNHRDTFYDAGLHGQDWEAVRRKYEQLLPSVGTRDELNVIIGEMQGEMNVSHEFVSGGYKERNPPNAPGVGMLAADLELDPNSHAYRFTRIFKGDGFEADARSPLIQPGIGVKPGDYLLAIDGTPLAPEQDPAALLIGKANKTVLLQVNTKPTTDGARAVRVKTLANDSEARYYDWVQRNREYVAKYGTPNIAYIHLPDMGQNGIAEFTKHFYANRDKDGMILDVRYNGGGIVSGQILERLRRVIFEYDQPRYGRPQPYHYTAWNGRVVVLCNERTGSDGEYFCTGLRYMKLGPTVGTRTWGGFMAVGGIDTLDGGFVSTPELGSFTPEGKWLPDGYGFNPDYVVEEDPNAYVAGHDPQMDKALDLMREELKRNPPKHIERQATPSKEKAFAPNKK